MRTNESPIGIIQNNNHSICSINQFPTKSKIFEEQPNISILIKKRKKYSAKTSSSRNKSSITVSTVTVTKLRRSNKSLLQTKHHSMKHSASNTH